MDSNDALFSLLIKFLHKIFIFYLYWVIKLFFFQIGTKIANNGHYIER